MADPSGVPQIAKRQEEVTRRMKDDATAIHLIRSKHVKAMRSFIAQSRRDMSSFPEHIKCTVSAMLDLEKAKYEDETNLLKSENDHLKVKLVAQTQELADVKDGLRKAIASLKDRDKLIAKFQPS